MAVQTWTKTYEQRTNKEQDQERVIYTLTASESNLTDTTSDVTVKLTARAKYSNPLFSSYTGFYGIILTQNGVEKKYEGKVGDGNTFSLGTTSKTIAENTWTITHTNGAATVNIKFYFYCTGWGETITNGGPTYDSWVPYPIGTDTKFGSLDHTQPRPNSTNDGENGHNYVLSQLTTACGAPTTVTASGIVAPSGSFTVSWTGAKSGTNNTIDSYQVYWRITSTGSEPTTSTFTGTKNVDVANGTTSGSTTITLSSATRGYKVVCGVVAKGTAGESFYSGIKTGGSITINSLPSAPTLNKSNQTIESSSDGISVTATPGTDSDGQTVQVYYSDSATGKKTRYTEAVTINPEEPGDSLTYYFWSYDTVEYSSSYKSITITKNLEPAFSNSPTVTASTYTHYYTAKDAYSCTNAVTPTIRLNKSKGTLTIIAHYTRGTGGKLPSDPTTSSPTLTLFSGSITSSSPSVGKIDINKKIADAKIYNGQYIRYRLSYTFNDGLESVTSNPSTIYLIAGASPLLGTYNRALTSSGTYQDLPGTTQHHFANVVGIHFRRDTEITKCNVIDIPSNTSITTALGTNYVNLTINTTQTSAINIKVELWNNAFCKATLTLPALYQRKLPTLENKVPTLDASVINPFTQSTGSTYLHLTWPFGSSTATTAAADYEFNSANLKLKLTYNNKTTSTTASLAKSGDELKYVVNYSTLFGGWGNPNSFNISNYVGRYGIIGQLEFTNYYGEVIASQPFNYQLNYAKAAVISDLSVQVAVSSTYIAIPTTSKFQEGMKYRLKCDVTTFSHETLTFNVQIKRGSTSYVNYKTIKLSSLTYGYTASGEVQTVYLDLGTIPEITDTQNRQFQLRAVGDATAEIGSYVSTSAYGVYQFTQPAITIDSIETNSSNNNQINVSYFYTEDGHNYSPITSVKFVNTSKSINVTISGFNVSASKQTKTLTIGTWTQDTFHIEINSTITQTIDSLTFTKTKTFSSNTMVAFNSRPTISYRKNRIGINNVTPLEETVVDMALGKSDMYHIRMWGGDENRAIWVNMKDGWIFSDNQSIFTSNPLYKLDLFNGTWSGSAATATTITSTLSISKGGTGATTAAAALQNLGGFPLTGGTINGDITAAGRTVSTFDGGVGFRTTHSNSNASSGFSAARTDVGLSIFFGIAKAGNYQGVYSNSQEKWLIRMDASGEVVCNGTATNVTGTVAVDHGGTGATTLTSNAVLLGNGTSAIKTVAKAAGALYATSATAAPVFGTLPIAQGGTGATTAANALSALGGFPKTGGTISGAVTVNGAITANGAVTASGAVKGNGVTSTSYRIGIDNPGDSRLFSFYKSGVLSAEIFDYPQNSTKNNCMYFRIRSRSSATGELLGYHEQYKFPVVAQDRTSNVTYEILSTRAAVTIAQGGTGAKTAAAARTNLGLGSTLLVDNGTITASVAQTFSGEYGSYIILIKNNVDSYWSTISLPNVHSSFATLMYQGATDFYSINVTYNSTSKQYSIKFNATNSGNVYVYGIN